MSFCGPARTDDGGPANVTVQLAADATFRKIPWSAAGSTIRDNDFTLQFNPYELNSGMRYFYRFAADTKSIAGQLVMPRGSMQSRIVPGIDFRASDGKARQWIANDIDPRRMVIEERLFRRQKRQSLIVEFSHRADIAI